MEPSDYLTMTLEQVKQLKPGERVWENSSIGGSIEIEILTAPSVEDGNYWTWKGNTAKGIIDFGIREGYEHYGPRITRKPTYGDQTPLAAPQPNQDRR
jgi:hypothetical protein